MNLTASTPVAMRRAAFALLCLALLVWGLLYGGPAVLAAAQGSTPAAGTTLTFDIRFRDTVLAAGGSGLALGDRFILSDRLLENGTEVGHNAGVCTITDPAGEAICEVVYALPGGTIATQFLNAPPPEKAFAILGGTGRYEGARGSGTLVEFGDETGSVAFRLVD